MECADVARGPESLCAGERNPLPRRRTLDSPVCASAASVNVIACSRASPRTLSYCPIAGIDLPARAKAPLASPPFGSSAHPTDSTPSPIPPSAFLK